jgi:hypothetical protein
MRAKARGQGSAHNLERGIHHVRFCHIDTVQGWVDGFALDVSAIPEALQVEFLSYVIRDGVGGFAIVLFYGDGLCASRRGRALGAEVARLS